MLHEYKYQYKDECNEITKEIDPADKVREDWFINVLKRKIKLSDGYAIKWNIIDEIYASEKNIKFR